MIWSALAPLLLSFIAATTVGRVIVGATPRTETIAVVATSVVLAAATLVGFGILAFCGIARLVAIVGLTSWAPATVSGTDPVPWWISATAAAAAIVLVRPAVNVIRAEVIELRAAHHVLDRWTDEHDVVRIPTSDVVAVAVARLGRRRGRVVVSDGLVVSLDDEACAAVVAHERAHLDHHHFAQRLIVRVAAAIDPLLGPLARRAEYTVERWADETAAHQLGPATTAAAIADVALRSTPATELQLAASSLGVVDRVDALLEPTRSHRPIRTWTATILMASLFTTIVVCRLTEVFVQHLMH